MGDDEIITDPAKYFAERFDSIHNYVRQARVVIDYSPELKAGLLSTRSVAICHHMTDDLERLTAMVFILSSRVAELERSDAQLRLLAGLDAPGPTLGSEWQGLKQAAHDRGLSVSARKRIVRGKVEARKIAGRWLVRK